MRPHPPSPRSRLAAALIASLAAAASACVEPVSVQTTSPAELAPGESRDLELRFLRFDVSQFEQTLTLEQLRSLPPQVLSDTWLFDLDLKPMVTAALEQIASLSPEDAAALGPAEKNLWRLLNMTPANADLRGTSLAALLSLGESVGLSPSAIFAGLVQSDANAPLIPAGVTAAAVLENLVATHPNAKSRRGPADAAHPNGLYPVAPGSIPVSLADVANDFAGLAQRYGEVPADPSVPGSGHPGFIAAASPVKAADEGFLMTVRVNIDALPYKAVDASLGAVASVNSTGSQIDHLFDFSRPDWLELTGLAADLRVGELTMSIRENADLIPSGARREPLPMGASPVWSTPAWELEHLLAGAGVARAASIAAHCDAYSPPGTSAEPFQAVKVCIDATGWTEIALHPSVVPAQSPPGPSYFWDILLEVAQLRLHDGGLAEGTAGVALTVKDVPVGISTADLVAKIRANLMANPAGLRAVAEKLNDNTAGDADFYYYQASSGVDYLYFVLPEDRRRDASGAFARPYSYAHPGFYADAELTRELSTRESVDGDSAHPKIAVEPGAALYFEDDQAQRFRVDVRDKPSPHRIALTLTRLQ